MKSNKREKWFARAVGTLLGIALALALFAVFYGAMAYQLAGGKAQSAQQVAAAGEQALLALPDAQLISEQTAQLQMGGTLCTVTTRTYKTQDGLEVKAVSASPAAYIERLAEEKWTAQLITGFTLAGLDAVYSVRGEEGMLSARNGERVYLLCGAAGEQALHALGAGAVFE